MTMPMFEGGPSIDSIMIDIYSAFPTRGNASAWGSTVGEAAAKEAMMQEMGVCPPTEEQDPVKRIQAWIDMVGPDSLLPSHLTAMRAIQERLEKGA